VYVVILDATLHGSSVMSTEDTVEAASAEEAEAEAIHQWSQAEPKLRFIPLYTAQVGDDAA
jgi:hypothetical protein